MLIPLTAPETSVAFMSPETEIERERERERESFSESFQRERELDAKSWEMDIKSSTTKSIEEKNSQ